MSNGNQMITEDTDVQSKVSAIKRRLSELDNEQTRLHMERIELEASLKMCCNHKWTRTSEYGSPSWIICSLCGVCK